MDPVPEATDVVYTPGDHPASYTERAAEDDERPPGTDTEANPPEKINPTTDTVSELPPISKMAVTRHAPLGAPCTRPPPRSATRPVST
jgi:hypothetical protein